MSNRNPSNFQSRSGRRVLATIALIIGMTGLAISIADGFWSNGQAPFPFVWRDVAVVHIASALPLAWFVTRMIRRRFRVIAFLCSAIGLIGICITWTLAGFSTELTWYAAIPTRAGLAFGIALPIAFVLREWSSDANEGLELRGGRSLTAALVTSVTALLALPTLYTNARCRQDCARLSEYLDQRRVGEARVIAHRVMALDAHAECRGQPIAKVAAILDSEVARLESLVLTPLPMNAPVRSHFERAQYLAMLGDTDRALEAIESISEEAFLPDVYNFRGTIYEARGDWALAVESFQLGLDTATRTEMQLRAITGLAYSQRKSGDYVGAAKSYQMLVTRAPTADSHFLLAQFYEDAQDAGKSRHHARQAMTLNPGRYQAEGEKLIRKLTVYQFGCLRAFGG